MAKIKSGKIKNEVSFKERCSFGLSSGVANMGSIIVAAFMAYYYTDVAGLPVQVAGMIAGICAVFDGISDMAMGIAIERTRSKWGKCRPWILFGGIFNGICLILTFWVPQFSSMTIRVIYAFTTYFLLKVIFQTMLGTAASTMITLITGKEKERNALGMYNVIFNVLLSAGASALTLPLVTALGNTQGAWSGVIGIYGVLIIIGSIAAFFGMKERVGTASGEAVKKAYPVKVLIVALIKNRYFWLLLIALSLYQLFAATGTINVYYYTRVLNNPTAYSISNLSSIVFLLFMPLYLIVTNKLGVRKAMLYSCLLAGILSMLRILAPTNVIVYVLLGFGSSLALGPFSTCYMSLTGEIADWGEWKTGIPTQAMVCSVTGLAGKISAGVGTTAITFVLARAGYDGALAVQPQSAITALVILGTIVGGIGYLLMALCIKFIDIHKDQEQMHKELDVKRGIVIVDEKANE